MYIKDDGTITLNTVDIQYAWIADAKVWGDKRPHKPEEVFCSWCGKSKKEILDNEGLDAHFKKHDDEELKI